MLASANAALAAFSQVMAEVERAMPEITELVRETSSASVALPTLLTQTGDHGRASATAGAAAGVWLFGGRDGDAAERTRLSPLEARP